MPSPNRMFVSLGSKTPVAPPATISPYRFLRLKRWWAPTALLLMLMLSH